MRRGPLHVRRDEEPDLDESHLIAREIWFYPGCRHCGHEDHRLDDCPNRPRLPIRPALALLALPLVGAIAGSQFGGDFATTIASVTPTSPTATAAPVPDSPHEGVRAPGVESGTENATQGEPCGTTSVDITPSTTTASAPSILTTPASRMAARTTTATSSRSTTSGESGTTPTSGSQEMGGTLAGGGPAVTPPTSPSPSSSTCASSASSDPNAAWTTGQSYNETGGSVAPTTGIIPDAPSHSDVQYAEVTERADRLARVAVGLPPVPGRP